MIGFKTERSTYYVDTSHQRITGGIFGQEVYDYKHLNCIQGCKAYITLKDNRVIETGIVVKYL